MTHRRFVIFAALLIGQMAIAQKQPAAPREFPIATIREQCPEFTEVKRGDKYGDFSDCRVSEFGEFGSVEGQTYYYALYCLIPSFGKVKCSDESSSARYYRSGALAIFVRDAAGTNARRLFERVTGDIGTLRYEPPKIIRAAAGTLLYLPIVVDGTGHFNQSEYFLRGGGAWEPIEAAEWRKDLGWRIPAGLGIWKGVWPDLETMTAVAHLYHPRDGNCCPSGGTARVGLAIESRHFVIKSFALEAPAP